MTSALVQKPFTVLVEGNIGCGKTTFLQHFSEFDGVCVLKEPVDKWRNVNGHNLLQLMYQNPKRYAMPFQSNVQLTMLELHNKKTSKTIKLMERSIFSARYCFVENLYRSNVIEASEFEVLSQWFEYVVNSSDIDLEVDLVVYLRTEPEKALDRIKARARGEENSIPLQYLQELHRLHDEWLLESKFKVPAPVLVINANQDKELMLAEYNKLESIIFNKSREKALVLKDNANTILHEINENQIKENIKENGKKNQIKENVEANGKNGKENQIKENVKENGKKNQIKENIKEKGKENQIKENIKEKGKENKKKNGKENQGQEIKDTNKDGKKECQTPSAV